MVRFSDHPTVETTIVVNAPVERLWDLVSDITFPSYFSNELKSAEWLDEPPALGARFVGRNTHPLAGEWETICTIEAFEPLRSFGYFVGDGDEPSARWRFDLEPLATGGVEIKMWARMGPGRSGVTYLIHKHPDREEEILANRLEEWRSNMDAVLAGIKVWAEGGGCCATSGPGLPTTVTDAGEFATTLKDAGSVISGPDS